MSREVFSIPAFIAWAETQDPKVTYDYANAETCVMTRYFRNRGVERSGAFCYGPIDLEADGAWSKIASGYPRTIDAALWRARAIVEG